MDSLTGDLEPDYDSDFWADHDEQCHGIIDSEFCRSEYPEGFVWDCCNKPGDDDEGCTQGRHNDVAGFKKARSDEPDLNSQGGTDGDEEDEDPASEDNESE